MVSLDGRRSDKTNKQTFFRTPEEQKVRAKAVPLPPPTIYRRPLMPMSPLLKIRLHADMRNSVQPISGNITEALKINAFPIFF